ncbi:MAG: response regulator transcription factor [Lachnospiraceae bacterium]|nr:response regulator transcription factor [Lachnospiraceae bacterium]
MRILIVEDERSLAQIVANRLKKEKYSVDIVYDGEEGLYNALEGIYDLILLDIMLPGINGIDILKKIKEKHIDSKVIMLTAKGELDDKLLGFSEGANDYVAKPFHIDELVARIGAQLRIEKTPSDTLTYADIELEYKTSKLRNINNGDSVGLNNKEFQLLEYFMNNPDRILSKEMIYDRIWGMDSEAVSNNLEVYLSFIRKKLKTIGSDISIRSVRNMGYKMEQQ